MSELTDYQRIIEKPRLEALYAKIDKMKSALDRINAVHLPPATTTDPDYLARLMQGIAREAIQQS